MPPTPRAVRSRRLLLPLIAGLAVVGGVAAVGMTSAAWTDSVSVGAPASAGTWASSPAPTADTGITGPLEPGRNTTIAATSWVVPADPTQTTCFTTQVSTAATTPTAWSVAIDLKQAPFYGASSLYYTGSTQATIAVNGNRATVTGVGSGGTWNPDWNNAVITSARTLPLTVCTSSPGTPTASADSAYTVTTARSGAWTRTQACVTTTVTSTRDPAVNPFFHGWRTKVDLSAATAALIAAGGTPTYTSWDPSTSADGYWFTTSPTDGTKVAQSFQVASGARAAIKAGQPVVLTTCVRG